MSLLHWSYVAMLLFCLAGTLPLVPAFRLRVLRQPGRLGLTILLAGSPFLAWDLYATHVGHWSFDPDQTLSWRVAGLPLEEIGFFVVIPLASVLTFEAVRALRGRGAPVGAGGRRSVDELHRARRPRRCWPAVALDRWVARTRLTSSRTWWTAYAIIVFFQLLTNGWLTGRRHRPLRPRHDPRRRHGVVPRGRADRLRPGGGPGLRLRARPDVLRGLGVAGTPARRRGRPVSAATRMQAMQPMDLGIPGPTPWDMARAFRSVRADPLSFLVDVQRSYGDLVAFPVPGAPALLVSEPSDVRHVLQTSARHWGKQTVQYAALGRVTGPGLLASSEPSWLEHRRVAAPAFHHQRLAAVSEQVRAAADAALAAGSVAASVRLRCDGRRRRPDAPHRPRRRRPGAVLRRPLGSRAAAARRLERRGRAGRAPRAVDPADRGVDPDPHQRAPARTRRRLDAVTAELIAHRRSARPGVGSGSGTTSSDCCSTAA